MSGAKKKFHGSVISIQPRIRLTRSFDERYHNYLGYSLRIDGDMDGEKGEHLIGIGKATQAKYGFRVGDVVSGECSPVQDPRLESVDYYKASKLKILHRNADSDSEGPPWGGVPPELEEYRKRGHKRLAARTYETKCITCIWGCRMPVEIIVDHWKPDIKKYRHETFCYGPKSCKFYKPGPTRKVPGRHGMTFEEEDWVDEQETSHRGEDE